jgi:hypothetical protein
MLHHNIRPRYASVRRQRKVDEDIKMATIVCKGIKNGKAPSSSCLDSRWRRRKKCSFWDNLLLDDLLWDNHLTLFDSSDTSLSPTS